MFDDSVYISVSMLIPSVAAIIYFIAFFKLHWEILWIGFVGAIMSIISGYDPIYDFIDYDNPEMFDYLLDCMWMVGWALEVFCLFLIVQKAIKLQSSNKDNNNDPI